MHTIEATYRINTPMFIAGANQQEAELRLPSFKGALRFWWRALAYGRYEGDLTQIREKEDEIFGSTSCQAKFLFRLEHGELSKAKILDEQVLPEGFNGLAYFGYGVCQSFTSQRAGTRQGRLTRPCIKQSQQFKTKISCHKNYINKSQKEFNLLKDAIKILGLLGVLGSKSRKGYGSLTLISMLENQESCFNNPKNKEEFEKLIKTILPQDRLLKDIPAYSAFSQHTRIEILKEDSNPMSLLNFSGLNMQRYRSWGHNGQVNGNPSERNFPEDHDWIRDLQREIPPKRMIFGLPYNNIELVKLDKNNINAERRASPLFLHIHYFDENNYGAIATILESQFLPKSICINTGQKRLESKVDYSVLHQFIDGRIGPRDNKTKEYYFPNRKTILGKPVKTEGSK